jgi:hypothetical protein
MENMLICVNIIADQLSRDDEQIQTAANVHPKRSYQKLLREVHQLYSGLHLYLQTGLGTGKTHNGSHITQLLLNFLV